jgi:drug/metabolite transporter (DMT)-like permease
MLSGKTFILLGWLDALAYLAAVAGQDLTTPGLSTLLSSFYVFLVPFFAWYLEGTKLNWKIGLVGLISLIGIFLISFNGDWNNFANSSMLGIIILMFAAIMWGLYTVISGKFLDISKNKEKKIDIMSFTYASLFHTFLALSFLTIITGEITFSIPLEIIPHIVFSGIFPTIIALGLWNWAIARLGSVSTSFYQLLQVIVPFILEFIFFQQIYSAWIYGGIILILMSSFLISDNQNESVEEIIIGNTTDQLSNIRGYKKKAEVCC